MEPISETEFEFAFGANLLRNDMGVLHIGKSLNRDTPNAVNGRQNGRTIREQLDSKDGNIVEAHDQVNFLNKFRMAQVIYCKISFIEIINFCWCFLEF